MYKFISKNANNTIELAENIESEKFENMVICLNGDLGSGKTLFTKGFAKALGIKEDVTSPTFNIVKEYLSGEIPLYHFDVYRLNGDVSTIGLEEYFKKNGVVIIEWADTIEDDLPSERLDLIFNIVGENTRVIQIIPHGVDYEMLCEDVLWYYLLILLICI